MLATTLRSYKEQTAKNWPTHAKAKLHTHQKTVLLKFEHMQLIRRTSSLSISPLLKIVFSKFLSCVKVATSVSIRG